MAQRLAQLSAHLQASTTSTHVASQGQAPHAEPDITSEPLMMYNWLCPYVHRVTLALGHKKAHIRRVDIDLNNKPAWLTKYSPLGKVPAVTYTEGGEQQVLYESLALLHWVDEYYQGPELLPGTPAQRTKARVIISRVDSSIVTPFYKLLRAPSKEEFKAVWEQLQAELTWLEQQMHATGPFLTGSRPTLVDATIAPWLLRTFVIKHYRNVDLLKGHPRLASFTEFYKALPEVQATFQHPQHGVGYERWAEAMVDGYAKYGGTPADFSDVLAA